VRAGSEGRRISTTLSGSCEASLGRRKGPLGVLKLLAEVLLKSLGTIDM